MREIRLSGLVGGAGSCIPAPTPILYLPFVEPHFLLPSFLYADLGLAWFGLA